MNWLEPRFRFTPANGEDLFEIRLHAPAETHDLVAYTTNSTWVLPRPIWSKFAINAGNQSVEKGADRRIDAPQRRVAGSGMTFAAPRVGIKDCPRVKVAAQSDKGEFTMRSFFAFGVALTLITACGGDTTSSTGNGQTGSGGTGTATGGASGVECTSVSQCAVPQICQTCPGGTVSCARADCVSGQCVTSYPPCNGAGTGGAGGAGSAGGATASGGATGTDACVDKTDCGGGRLCGFPTADQCSAKGTCFPAPGAICNAILPGCACDGSMVNLACNGLPSGYAPKPTLHSGACATTQ